MMTTNVTNIPGARVPFLNHDGTVSRYWYRFFNNMFDLTGGGGSQTSITDLLIAPSLETTHDASGSQALAAVGSLPEPVYDPSGELALAAVGSLPYAPDLAPIYDALQALSLEPVATPAGIGVSWPVGSIHISVTSTNPSITIGFGTWVAFGTGQVMVGLDSGNVNFDTPEETGGALTVASSGTISGTAVAAHPAHTHTIAQSAFTTDTFTPLVAGTSAYVGGGTVTTPSGNPSASLTHTVTDGAFTGAATSVVQPYIVVYMWKRTA